MNDAAGGDSQQVTAHFLGANGRSTAGPLAEFKTCLTIAFNH